jgi:NAD(P)-dependent dehydrogenase (short-subunit alcohol dehydrogenase family)
LRVYRCRGIRHQAVSGTAVAREYRAWGKLLMANRLAGKVALVTGIGAGIGQGCALIFAREGATVFGCDIDGRRAAATVASAQESGLKIDCGAAVDLTQADQVQACVDELIRRHGRIDVLVNAGAINPQFAPTAQMSYEKIWVPTLVGEVDIVFLMCKAVWPHLVAAGGGSIVNFASVAAYRGAAFAGMLAHCAGKGAVLSMTRQLALEGAPHRIRANTIAPGLVATLATASQGMTAGEKREQMESSIPLGRIGKPEDIAYCALYLASDEASWVTGTNITVDGGITAG